MHAQWCTLNHFILKYKIQFNRFDYASDFYVYTTQTNTQARCTYIGYVRWELVRSFGNSFCLITLCTCIQKPCNSVIISHALKQTCDVNVREFANLAYSEIYMYRHFREYTEKHRKTSNAHMFVCKGGS